MGKVLSVLAICLISGFFMAPDVFGHTPLCSCWDNGDGTVTCEGGFSDGSSGAGIDIRVVDNKSGTVLVGGNMDEDSEFTFNSPDVPYRVQYDAGPGHLVEIDGGEIVE